MEAHLLPHQQRVVDEKTELDLKIKNLQNFIETNSIYETLIDPEKRDLKEQLTLMLHYSLILGRRINRF